VKDLGSIMKQAQGLQAKMAEAQAKLAQTVVEGQAGGGLVRVGLSGGGVMVAVNISPELMEPGEGETLQDLILAAHADAKARMDAESERVMKEAMGPLAGMAGGMPGFPGLR
jgi:DNA-binding YbaB/EbfC family protein